MQTLTAKELIRFLSSLPSDTRVYLSSDEEGNNYATTSTYFGTEVYEKDKVLILYPQQIVDFEDIAPIYVNNWKE